MIVNCWIDKGAEPGEFPTGGPVARVFGASMDPAAATPQDPEEYAKALELLSQLIEVAGACVALPLGPDEAYLIALNCKLGFVSCDAQRPHVDYLAVEDGELVRSEDGSLRWHRTCRLNGDEVAMLHADAPRLLRVSLMSYA